MKINFYATLRQIVGGKSISIPEMQGKTVQQMLDELLDLFPGLRKELFAPDGNLYGHVHVFINGRDVQQLAEGLDYAIQAEDTINIFPAVGGG